MVTTICQKCGDPGFSVALIYCDKCQKVAEHRYCLDVIPKTFTEYVTWFCEDCKPKDLSLKDEIKIRSLEFEKRKHSNKSSKQKKVSNRSTPRSSEYLPTDERVVISPVGHESSQSGQPLCQSNASDRTCNDGAMDTDDPGKSNMHNVCNVDTETSKLNMDHTALTISTSEVVDRNAFVPSQPIYEPVWRGCFNICVGQFGIIGGIAAHLSTKASLQVYKEASLFSESLCPELVPRLNIWPKGFIKSGPKDENIALYFFPQNESYEKEYAILVDHMVECDLAMRAAGVNADLLIFTSMELPLSIWRFQAKYYLWGVFRGKDPSSSGSAVRNQVLTHNTTEIDAGNKAVKKSHRRRSPHSPLSNGSSHGSAS